jgi:DNA transformation protein
MDRDFLLDLFAPFGPVTIRRMFSGYGISADGINFALALRGTIYLRADADSIARFEAEGSQPFAYQTKARSVTVASYWQLPERLFDDPDELAQWARVAHAAAGRAALAKASKAKAVGSRAKKMESAIKRAKKIVAKKPVTAPAARRGPKT